jgi:hypothetical protein
VEIKQISNIFGFMEERHAIATMDGREGPVLTDEIAPRASCLSRHVYFSNAQPCEQWSIHPL